MLECPTQIAPVETVVLLDAAGRPQGRADKASVHGATTPLHLGFSIFLFDHRGRTLFQQRAWTKQTWPGIWSNACCGHPMPGEALEAAAHLRLDQELGLSSIELRLALPYFRYRASYLGVEENEICPVFIGCCQEEPQPNPLEVAATKWIDWQSFLSQETAPAKFEDTAYSPWSRMEAAALAQTGI